ncbi:sirohydrochlorin cobaltochelatase [Parabacteroides hominis]|uniref:Sirohydrochlorin cobaltochelatase n=1 Tax=Parabacteroides hominis TaxID=2763057 RepID=A0ABR7DKZ9_9BACT|nr:sirohydrochlorin cobaltochelatase [Parabacteroides hominis]MBC5632110.1 sirohydrochlorin cobaltochelatase [Parabacteroides hominis]MBD9167629.1 sirohydrochlorin cobaltochelatase [Parabacteroides johnsonii]
MQSIQAEGNFVESDMFASMQTGDKAAVLVVHFGTTHDDTRALTIDAINKKMADAFPGIEVREAWTSRIIAFRLKTRGIHKSSPEEALARLKAEGYTHVLIQSSNIIEGIEMESLRKDVTSQEKGFKEIRIGTPLLFTPEDYEATIAAITPNGIRDGAVLLVGHGTYTPTTAQYAMMDYMLKAKGFGNYVVGTIEGYPSFDDALNQIKKGGYKKVRLMPFMFVAGEHAKNDIAGDWKDELEKQGYEVTVFMEGLGQNPAIQNIFVEHARFNATHKYLDIVKKKKDYAKGKEKYE